MTAPDRLAAFRRAIVARYLADPEAHELPHYADLRDGGNLHRAEGALSAARLPILAVIAGGLLFAALMAAHPGARAAHDAHASAASCVRTGC